MTLILDDRTQRIPEFYLGSPYSHPHIEVREQRYEIMVEITWRLMSEQDTFLPYSPIVNTHPMVHLIGDFDIVGWDLKKLRRCDAAIFFQIDGWRESKGMAREMEFCENNHIPMLYWHPDEIDGLIIAANENFKYYSDFLYNFHSRPYKVEKIPKKNEN